VRRVKVSLTSKLRYQAGLASLRGPELI
jgi:hypothetical protein